MILRTEVCERVLVDELFRSSSLGNFRFVAMI